MKVFDFIFSDTGNNLYVGLDRTILFEFARQSAGLWLPKSDFLGLFLGGEPVDANEVEGVCLHSFHEVSESIRSKGIEWGYKSHCKYRNHDSQVLGVLVGTPVTKLCHIVDGFWYAQSSPFSGYHSSRDHSVLSYLKSDVQQQVRGRFAMLDMALQSRLDVKDG